MKFKKRPPIICFGYLKLYTKDDKKLDNLLSTVKQFSNDISMEYGLDKCVKATFMNGKLTRTSAVQLDINTTICELDQHKTYKYVGIDRGNGIQHIKIKEKIRKVLLNRRAKVILKTELNSAKLEFEFCTLAVSVVQHIFNIINWILEYLRRIDTKIRKLLTCYKMHHPKVDKDQLYLPRSEGAEISSKQN